MALTLSLGALRDNIDYRRLFTTNSNYLRSFSQIVVNPVMEIGAELKGGELIHEVAVWYAVKGFSNIKEYGAYFVTII